MSGETNELSAREQRVNELIAAYLEAVDAGETPDPKEFIAAHGEIAAELESFFANRDEFDRMAEPLQPAGAAAPKAQHDDVTLPPADEPTEAPTLAPTETAGAAIGTMVRYFGDYELLEEIARGGMGVVYKARQVSLNRVVALKMILAGQLASEEDVQRFHAEAEAAANLDHPGIVPIYEVGEHEGQHYFSMGFVEGSSLSAKVADGPLPPKKAAEYTKKVAEAVAFAHEHGVIHRDLKPANVLLDANDEPKVTDFGLAKKVEGDEGLTATGQILGTPGYMPPEQASGKIDEVTETADIYSLGAILYCLLTARPPFQADNPLDTLMQVLEREPVSPRQLNPKVPRDLETICLKCLEKDRRRRYTSAQELADELTRFLNGEPIHARPISRPARVWRWCRRKPIVASLTAAVILLLLTLSIAGPLVALQQAQNASEQARLRQQANMEREKAVAAQQQEAQQRTLAEENEKLATEKAAEAEREREKAEAAKLEEVKQRELAEENENRARAAREQSLDALSASLYQQAIAVRNASKPGRRWSALDLLKQAEELRDREHELEAIDTDLAEQKSAVEAQLPTRSELRSEAVAALFMQDARLVWERRWDTVVAVPSVSPRGHRAAVAWARLGDFNLNASGVRLIDLADGSDIQIPKNPRMWGTAVGLSPDGKMLASPPGPLAPKGMALWDVDRGTLSRTLDWPQEASFKQVNGVVFSPNGRFLAAAGKVRYSAGSPPGTDVVVWNLETGTARTASAINTGPLMRVAFSADGKYLVYQSDKKKISLWNLESDEKPIELELPLHSANQFAFSPNQEILAVFGSSVEKNVGMVILLWDPVKNAERGRIEMEVGAGAAAMAFSPDGSLLAGSDEKGSIYFFDLATRKEAFRLQSAHKGIVNFLWWEPDSRHLLSSGLEWSLKYWELPRESLSSTFKTNLKDLEFHFAINPDRRQIAVMGSRLEPGVRLINRDTGQTERTLDGTEGSTPKPRRSRPELLLYRHDGRQLAQIGQGLAVVWEVETGDEVARWELDPAVPKALSSAAFTADGQLLASGKTGKTAIVWNVATGERLWQAPRDYLQAHLSPDGRRVAVTPVELFSQMLAGQLLAGEEKGLAVWELATGRELNDLQGLDREKGSIGAFPLFSPDGHWLVAVGGLTGVEFAGRTMGSLAHAGSANAYVALWHPPSGERRRDIRGSGVPTSYAFSPGSRMLAIGYRDGSAQLWDLANNEMIFRWKEHSAAITRLVFTPDGSEIASVHNFSRNIRFLDLTGLRRQLADVGLDW